MRPTGPVRLNVPARPPHSWLPLPLGHGDDAGGDFPNIAALVRTFTFEFVAH